MDVYNNYYSIISENNKAVFMIIIINKCYHLYFFNLFPYCTHGCIVYTNTFSF